MPYLILNSPAKKLVKVYNSQHNTLLFIKMFYFSSSILKLETFNYHYDIM